MTKLSVVLAMVGVCTLVVVGCVIRTEHTIDAHVVVDIRHSIEEQADDVLDFIEGRSDTLPKGEENNDTSWLRIPLEFFSPVRTAYAAELKSSSPTVTEIAKRLRERFEKLELLRKGGCLGENNNGYVELRPCDLLKDREAKHDAQQLVASENGDRKALYMEIARLNKEDSVTLSLVERVYAERRLERAREGQVFQLPPEGEEFEKFNASPKGKRLGDACVPGAWVEIK